MSTTVPADVATTGANVTRAGERPPVAPALATIHSSAGGVAFAEFFIQTIDWGYATTSSAYMKHYYQASCDECSDDASGIDEGAKARHRFIGDRLINIRAELVNGGDPQTYDLAVKTTFDVTAFEEVDKVGKSVDAAPPMPGFVETVFLDWRGNGWTVSKMDSAR
jgi:hypothetical protein